MGFIIGLIVSVAVMTAFIAYYLTREEDKEVEESPLQKAIRTSMDKSAKDIKVKDAVVVKPRVTKVNASPELLQFIEQSNELAKELEKIPTQDLVAYAAKQQEAKPEVQPTTPTKKRTRRPAKKTKTQQ